jgi:tetratricopeptide (TPR) repeat protein
MSDNSGSWFNRLFKKASQSAPKQDPGPAPEPTPQQDLQPRVYKKGDFIGEKYEVYGILGKGGFGVVYLVYSHELREILALKTFQDEFLANPEVRIRFQREASLWVELGRHPYLVRAYVVENVAGRLYLVMEYIAPNEEGLNSLEGYLQRRPPDLAQSLRWAIQVCHGMEYAYSKGVRAHRDLKPANIMIGQDQAARITDFGLAGVISESPAAHAAGLGVRPGEPALAGQTMRGEGFGTPTHMAPEQFDNAAGCDERSDIYSFGIVLYQMAAGGRVPFFAPLGSNFWQVMWRLHRETPVPRLDSPLFPIIQRCLEKAPEKRYQTFKELRDEVEPLLQHQTGEVIIPPQLNELEAWEWSNKGISLRNLGQHEEAIRCYDQSLKLFPRNATVWSNKGADLTSLGRHQEAFFCLDKALEIDPRNIYAWNNIGNTLTSLGQYEKAFHYYNQAHQLDPRNPTVLNNKGNSLNYLGRYEEAVHCLDQALELDPRDVDAWNNKGNSLTNLGRHEEAIRCYDQALEIDPYFVATWYNKALEEDKLGRYEEAIRCYNKVLELDPGSMAAWFNKALAEDKLGHFREAGRAYQQFLAVASAESVRQIEFARKRLRQLGG